MQQANRTVCSFSPQLSELKYLPNRTPLASLNVKLFGQEISFANIDKDWIDQTIGV